jgi:hypothetical protein
MENNAFLYSLFKTPALYGRIKIGEEHQECIKFANFCKASTLDGSLYPIWFHVANETGDNKRKVWGALLQAMGKICGVSDYVFMSGRGCGCIEFKTEARYNSKNQGLSESQQLFRKWVEKADVPYAVVFRTEDAIQYLKDWKMLNA